MEKGNIKILIVEDNVTFGKVLKEKISQAGYEAILVSSPNEAIYHYKLSAVNAFVIDCLLPQMSISDLVLKLRELGATQQPLFFISAVFQESILVDIAQQKTQKIDFFSKPFDIKHLIKKLDQCLKKTESKKNLLSITLTKSYLSYKERLSIINSTTKIHGFVLPYVIKLLLFPKISGILKLRPSQNPNKENCIYFFQGKIASVKIDHKETKSFFGEILIDKNLLSFEELEPFLSDKAHQIQLGKRLIQANLISPHMIDVIIKEQVSIRLNQLIKDSYYNMSFEETSVSIKEQSASLDQKDIKALYIRCFTSKIPFDYIKNTYLDKLDYKIQPTSDFSISIFQLHLFKNTKHLFNKIKESDFSLISLLNKYPRLSKEIYVGIHFLSVTNMIYLKPIQGEETSQMTVLRLRKIADDMADRNHFEVLNISKKAKESDISQAYRRLSMSFHPERLTLQQSQEAKDLVDFIFDKIQKAYEVLSDKKKRSDYELSLEYDNSKVVLKAEHLFEEGKQALRLNNRKTALDLLQKAVNVHVSPPPHFKLYLIQAQLLNFLTADSKLSENWVSNIQTSFDSISSENRNTSLFYLVKGLFYKQLKDKEAAKRNFEYALHLEPTSAEIKRELKLINYDIENKAESLLHGDLVKDVIPRLFSKVRKTWFKSG